MSRPARPFCPAAAERDRLKRRQRHERDLATIRRYNDEARKANTLAVIDFVLCHTLRLFHPFLPFITEELWHGMGYAEDMPENQGGQTIMFAPWPKPLDDDFKSHYGLTGQDEKHIEARNDLVTQGRNLRRTANIPASKKIKFILKPARELAAARRRSAQAAAQRRGARGERKLSAGQKHDDRALRAGRFVSAAGRPD